MAKRRSIEFESSGVESTSISDVSKKNCMYDLRTGKPFSIPEEDQYGRCRPVTDFEKLNRIGEGTYGIVYRARDTVSGIICLTGCWKSWHSSTVICSLRYCYLYI